MPFSLAAVECLAKLLTIAVFCKSFRHRSLIDGHISTDTIASPIEAQAPTHTSLTETGRGVNIQAFNTGNINIRSADYKLIDSSRRPEYMLSRVQPSTAEYSLVSVLGFQNCSPRYWLSIWSQYQSFSKLNLARGGGRQLVRRLIIQSWTALDPTNRVY